MKHKLFFALFILVTLLLTGCGTLTDAEKFKEEYESLNGEEINGNTVRTIEINKNNPFIYASAGDILDKIDNNETFAVYFGFNECPWCRSVITTLIDVASDLEIDKIYYVDIKDIRDTLELDENNNVATKKEGTDDYYKLLDKLSGILDDYTLTSDNEESVNTNEKRIYAPSVVAIVDGKAENLTTGISDEQNDAYEELTDEMIEHTYNKFKCTLECITESKNSCSKEKKC